MSGMRLEEITEKLEEKKSIFFIGGIYIALTALLFRLINAEIVSLSGLLFTDFNYLILAAELATLAAVSWKMYAGFKTLYRENRRYLYVLAGITAFSALMKFVILPHTPWHLQRYSMYFIHPTAYHMNAYGIGDRLFMAPSISILHYLLGRAVNGVGTFDTAFLMNHVLGVLLVPLTFFTFKKLSDSRKHALITAGLLAVSPLFNYISVGIEYNLGSIFFLVSMVFLALDYIDDTETGPIKFLPVFLAMLLSQAGRPEFQVIAPAVLLLTFLVYDRGSPSDLDRKLLGVSMAVAALYTGKLIIHFMGGDTAVTGGRMAGSSLKAYLLNSLDIGLNNLAGRRNIFELFLQSPLLRNTIPVLAAAGVLSGYRKQKKVRAIILSAASTGLFLYFYTFWHADGPFPVPGKYSPMIFYWLLPLEALGLMYLPRKLGAVKVPETRPSGKKLLTASLATVLLLTWVLGFYTAYMNFQPETYGNCDTTAADYREMNILEQKLGTPECPFIVQKMSVIPGLYGARTSYFFFNPDIQDVGQRALKFADYQSCIYLARDSHCREELYWTDMGDYYSQYSRVENRLKNCPHSLKINRTVGDRQLKVYRFNTTACLDQD